MTNKEQDTYSNATSNLIKKFVDSNQRKRINLLTQIEAEVENIFNLLSGNRSNKKYVCAMYQHTTYDD